MVSAHAELRDARFSFFTFLFVGALRRSPLRSNSDKDCVAFSSGAVALARRRSALSCAAGSYAPKEWSCGKLGACGCAPVSGSWASKGTMLLDLGAGSEQAYGLAFDADGMLYVVARDLNAVRRYAADFKQFAVVAGGNGRGSDLKQLCAPVSMSIEPVTKRVIVAYSLTCTVMSWAQGASAGTLVAGVNTHASKARQREQL